MIKLRYLLTPALFLSLAACGSTNADPIELGEAGSFVLLEGVEKQWEVC
jgi:hypothetical protein